MAYPWYPTGQHYGYPWGHPQAYPQQAPHPWGAQAYTDAYGANPPIAAQFSEKYPTLNPILAIDTTKLRFDIRRNPQSEILASTYYSQRNLPAKASPTFQLRLISKVFPWTIDIQTHSVNITCGMVWDAIYNCLQQPLEDSEWGLIISDKKTKERVEVAYKKRIEAGTNNGDVRMKRIDFLGDATLFKGLDKDEEFAKSKLMPGGSASASNIETYHLKITS